MPTHWWLIYFDIFRLFSSCCCIWVCSEHENKIISLLKIISFTLLCSPKKRIVYTFLNRSYLAYLNICNSLRQIRKPHTPTWFDCIFLNVNIVLVSGTNSKIVFFLIKHIKNKNWNIWNKRSLQMTIKVKLIRNEKE